MAVSNSRDPAVLEVEQRREEYLAFVAHDLRTPLNAIALASTRESFNRRSCNAVPRPPKMSNTLRRNVQHLGRIGQSGHQENTNLQTEIGIKLERPARDWIRGRWSNR